MSREILTGLLKGKMRFNGLVLSDCMMMGAIRDYYGTVEGVAQAIKAGVDLVFVSHDAELAAQAVQRVMDRLQEGTLSRGELQASTEKILRFKAALLPPDADGLRQVGSKEHRQQVDRLYEQSLTAVSLPQSGLPEIGNNPLFIGCLPYIPTQVSSPNRLKKGFHEALQGRFGGDAVEMTENPDGEEIQRIAARAPGHSCIAIGVYNAHLRRGQLNLVDALAAAGIPLIVVALRNPYDLASLSEGVSGIAAWAYNAASLNAVMKLLGGEIIAVGTLPVRLKGK
jgi:beta-N-acetylhexosaminidase